MTTELRSNIDIQVKTRYIEEQSIPDEDKYVFAYTIRIINMGQENAKLINRYWLITDSDGKKTEVSGAGVVGKQPELKPNNGFEYTSGSVVDTPVATMQGHYEFQFDDGTTENVPIDVFRLALPNILN